MKRFASLSLACAVVASIGFALLAGGTAGAKSASSLPTLTLALNGKSVKMGGSAVSGAVRVLTTVTGEHQGQPALIELNPGVSYSEFALAIRAVNSHHGDLNYLNPYGRMIFDASAPQGKSSAETVLAPGRYFALDAQQHSAVPPHTRLTVTRSSSPASLPRPDATEASIEFGFTGPKKLHRGEVVRAVNRGFLVHMAVYVRVKNMATARRIDALLRAGKDHKALPLAEHVQGAFFGPLSAGGLQQEKVTSPPGIYVELCFMDTQDGREHTQLGMERIIRIVK